MLGDRIKKHGTSVFLMNTGWTGGRYGVGKRMDLAQTRAMVDAVTVGCLDDVETKRHHDIFNVEVPLSLSRRSRRSA